MLKLVQQESTSEEEDLQILSACAETARRVHKSKQQYTLLPSAKAELIIIWRALTDPHITNSTPIAHLASVPQME